MAFLEPAIPLRIFRHVALSVRQTRILGDNFAMLGSAYRATVWNRRMARLVVISASQRKHGGWPPLSSMPFHARVVRTELAR